MTDYAHHYSHSYKRTGPSRLSQCIRAAVFFTALVITIPAVARTELQLLRESDPNVEITLHSCFEYLPACGFAPVDVVVKNRSNRDGAWDLSFSSPSGAYNASQWHSGARITVAAQTTRTVRLVIPLSILTDSTRYQPRLSVSASGYGVDASANLVFGAPPNNGKARTAFVAMSEALSTQSWGAFEKKMENQNRQLSGSSFTPAELPEDWRALSGVAAIWITDSEWTTLATAQRLAINDWIAQGGRLIFCNSTGELPAELAKLASWGFGKIIVQKWDGKQIDAATLSGMMGSFDLNTPYDLSLTIQPRLWGAFASVGELTINAPLLIVFVGLFGVLVGPINLFVFARGGRRARLFWTTPLISIGATALLMGLIVLQDGFGGHGHRLTLVHLLPSDTKAVIRQEQLSRTGVLMAQTFSIRDNVFLAPIVMAEDSPQIQIRMARQRDDQRTYEQANQTFGGDWFSSRSMQAHYATAILPTRAKIELLNAREVSDNAAAPVILSSIAGTLREISFADSTGKLWRAENVRVGEKATMQSRGEGTLLASFDRKISAGPLLHKSLSVLENQRNVFYAVSSDPSGVAIDTLPSIRWAPDEVIYIGPMTTAATP